MTTPRLQLIGDATIAILAGQGMRGLTHRAVDQHAGLPPGTTSNYARTRAALLELSLARMNELERSTLEEIGRPPVTLDQLADRIAAGLHHSVTVARERMIARYELALEATRRPELRAAYDETGLRIRRLTEAVLASAGSPDPAGHARAVISWAEGAAFYALAGTGHIDVPGREELRAELEALLSTLCVTPAT